MNVYGTPADAEVSSSACATPRSRAPSSRCRPRVRRRCCRCSIATPRRPGRSRPDRHGDGARTDLDAGDGRSCAIDPWRGRAPGHDHAPPARCAARGPARRVGRAGRRRARRSSNGTGCRPSRNRGRRSRERLASAPPDRLGGRPARRRVPHVSSKGNSQGEFVFDHDWAIGRPSRRHPVLSEAARRRAVHAGHRPAASSPPPEVQAGSTVSSRPRSRVCARQAACRRCT